MKDLVQKIENGTFSNKLQLRFKQQTNKRSFFFTAIPTCNYLESYMLHTRRSQSTSGKSTPTGLSSITYKEGQNETCHSFYKELE